ncbi:MAG: hypothetical protein ACLFOY_18200 [Desulfatibacillaceae bacterium]
MPGPCPMSRKAIQSRSPKDASTADRLRETLERLIQGGNRTHVTAVALRNALPAPVLRELGLDAGSGAGAVAGSVEPLLSPEHEVRIGAGGVPYVGRRLAPEAIVAARLRASPGLTGRQLGRNLAVDGDEFLEALNSLLERGEVAARITASRRIRLYPAPVREPPSVQPGVAPDDGVLLHHAFIQASNGRRLVPIYAVREILGWPRYRFDRCLEKLRADYAVELHGGDPGLRTADEISDSYVDANGILYLTMSWMKGA